MRNFAGDESSKEDQGKAANALLRGMQQTGSYMTVHIAGARGLSQTAQSSQMAG